jgi:hypothetical protein
MNLPIVFIAYLDPRSNEIEQLSLFEDCSLYRDGLSNLIGLKGISMVVRRRVSVERKR